MTSRIGAGVVAGLAAGVVFGMMISMMSVPTPDGGSMPMMVMIASVVGSTSMVVGWIYHLFNSAVIGGLFGALLGGKVTGAGAGALWGGGYGLLWWVLGGLILMPIMLKMPAFSPLTMEPMRTTAMMSAMGHLIFGVILGIVFAKLYDGTAVGGRAVRR